MGSSVMPPISRFVFKFVTVEPAFLFYMIAYTMIEFCNTNLYLQKACRFNQTTEPDLATPCDDTEQGVITVAFINTYVQSAKYFVVYACLAIYSTWSDVAGRKRRLFLLLAPLGISLECAILCLHVHWWSLAPIYAGLSSAVLQILFGNSSTMLAFGCMYLSDIVDLENRTMRLGIYSSMWFLGSVVGKGLSGILLHSAGFFRYYAICFVISLISLSSAYLCIEDTSLPVEKRIMPWSAPSLRHFCASFEIVLGRGKIKERIVKFLLLSNYCLLIFVHYGQLTVVYLYLRYIFDWNELMYGLFLFYGCIGTVVGTLFSSVILSKICKMHDALIGIIASLWDAAIAISYIFASENWQLYLASGMDIFYGVSSTVSISLLTKFFDTSEMGNLFAMKQLFCLSTPVCHPLYNILLKKTLHTLPTAIYFVSFGLYLVAVIIYCIIYILEKSKMKSNTYKLTQNGGEYMVKH